MPRRANIYVLDDEGNYLVDSDGNYVIAGVDMIRLVVANRPRMTMARLPLSRRGTSYISDVAPLPKEE